MQAMFIFTLPVMLTLFNEFSVLLNGHALMLLADLAGAVALLVVAATLLSTRTSPAISWKVLGIGICLIAGAVILGLLASTEYSVLASQSGIMLASPDGPMPIVFV